MDGALGFTLLGGIGLFLLGMQTMTGALRQLAGQRTRNLLARFTTSPLSGVATGAATTALIQSSSATVMTTIGFVGAGLLTFPQALGVIFGANIGTTVTGWMVAILGLKLELGRLALPLAFAGALLATLGRGARAQAGMLMAGFALVFLGLAMMQAGAGAVEPLLLRWLAPGEGLLGRLGLVATGVLVTAIVQSSSAGVAATLVLLSAGTIDIVQAAAMVVGMDIGTTLKSLLASLGGSRAMRRTAAAHVGYNVVTGAAAFLILPLVPAFHAFLGGDAPTTLVAFHTLFNVAGAALLLPFVGSFARLIERIVPGSGQGELPEPLDRKLLDDAGAALDTARAQAGALAAPLFGDLARRIRAGGRPAFALDAAERAVDDLEDFLTTLSVPPDAPGPRHRLAALNHLCDHLGRLLHRAGQDERLLPLRTEPALRRPARALAAALERAAEAPADAALARRLARLHRLIAGRTTRLRRSVLLREAAGIVAPRDVFRLTDSLRWLERSCAHAERIVHYGAVAARETPEQAASARA